MVFCSSRTFQVWVKMRLDHSKRSYMGWGGVGWGGVGGWGGVCGGGGWGGVGGGVTNLQTNQDMNNTHYGKLNGILFIQNISGLSENASRSFKKVISLINRPWFRLCFGVHYTTRHYLTEWWSTWVIHLQRVKLLIGRGHLTRCVKFWVAHASGMPGAFSPPPTSKKPRTRGGGENVPGACAIPNLRIWQEAH